MINETSRTTFDNFYSSPANGDLRREYYAEIAEIVADAIKECADLADLPEGDEDEPVIDEEAVRDFIQQTIYGHQWVIYTGKALLVPMVSDADPVEYLSDLGYTLDQRTPELCAYACMIQDAEDELLDKLDEAR